MQPGLIFLQDLFAGSMLPGTAKLSAALGMLARNLRVPPAWRPGKARPGRQAANALVITCSLISSSSRSKAFSSAPVMVNMFPISAADIHLMSLSNQLVPEAWKMPVAWLVVVLAPGLELVPLHVGPDNVSHAAAA
eukprot:s685_g2.t1